ncbi:MAG TPA: hydantoinase B/oxoprolinase family protein [Candidatus Methylomirabilis sp.]|nr:hydantoinase B/oxoprolinase family protein [Candidatus Methylomirabilis sp.]
MAIDKVLLEVLNNRFTGIVEEMGYVIHRASFTVFVKETWDFDSALVTTGGEIFCYPRNIGVTNMLGMSMAAAIESIPSYEPGDVIVTNDPHRTRGMCTHLPDIMMFRPLFHEGRLVCFAWCFIHSSDVGGLVPGSISPTAFDQYQEGLQIPPTKLFRRGELNEELLRLILANCRIPDQNWGDMKALLAALTVAERRLDEVLAQYGGDTVREAIPALLDYGERRARQIFEAIPDGRYEFWDYLEGDLFARHDIRIKVAVTVTGTAIHLDFTGTDPQLRAALNMPTYDRPNQWIVLGIVNYLRTTDRSLPLNRGMLRPVTVDVPKGSLLNPLPFVATGVRHATGYRVSDSVLGALSQAVPARIPAAGAGQVAIVLLSHLDAASGNYKVNVLQPMQGGCGGRPSKDGIDGVNFSAGSLRNVPTESIELEAPIFVKRYMLRDEVAPGRYRGGAGVVFEFQVNTPNTVITARGMERFRFQPWGRVGAGPGAPGQTLVNPGEPDARLIGKIDVLKVEPGTTVRILSPGGGGYGNPFDRDPAAVAKDVADGLVTAAAALDEYGVVLTGGDVDVAATERRRAARRSARSAPAFSFGKEREAYESRFPPALQDAVAAELMNYPASSRHFWKEQVYDVLAAEPFAGQDPMDLRERVRAAFKTLSTLAAG